MQLDASAITNTISPWRTLMERSSWYPWLCSGTLLRHWGSSVWCVHEYLHPVFPLKWAERETGVLMQACFIPQQDETLRVQSCLCAAHCYSDVPPLRLDIRPYTAETFDWTYLYTPLTLALRNHHYTTITNESGCMSLVRALSPPHIYGRGSEKKDLLCEA